MMDLLVKSHQHLTDCSCAQDPDKDGCYRCVFQYRLSRQIENISRKTALEILDNCWMFKMNGNVWRPSRYRD